MIREDILGYYIAVYNLPSNADLSKLCKDEYVICLSIPRKYVRSYRQLVTALYHYIDTLYIKKWIRNRHLRYAAFLFRESQISKITRLLETDEDKVLIAISKEGIGLSLDEIDLPMKSELDELASMAMFKLNIEKERK